MLKERDVSDFKGGVMEMIKSPEGRKRLAEIQKRHEIDLLTPSDPRFERVYGEKQRKQQEVANQKREKYIEEYNRRRENH